MTFAPTLTQMEYLDTAMNKVSRSFALVVPFLEEPLNHYMAAAYLICRVVDNIEDCELPVDQQLRRFAEFRRLLHEPTRAEEILTDWEHQAWPGLTPDEVQMMGIEGGLALWQIYALMPQDARNTIGRWALAMAEGMTSVNDPGQAPMFATQGDVQVLASGNDYDRYCYFVAGTVGHMATELAVDFYGLNGGATDRLLANSEACGRGLQKTNIVKDFPKDLERGVCYLPDEWMTEIAHSPLSLAGAPPVWTKYVLDDVLGELQDAVSYMLDLPYTAAGYRMAGLLCLLPAYQTILQAAQNYEILFTPNHHVKISRDTMFQCLEDARMMVMDNEAILDYSQRTRTHVDVAFNGAGKPSSK